MCPLADTLALTSTNNKFSRLNVVLFGIAHRFFQKKKQRQNKIISFGYVTNSQILQNDFTAFDANSCRWHNVFKSLVNSFPKFSVCHRIAMSLLLIVLPFQQNLYIFFHFFDSENKFFISRPHSICYTAHVKVFEIYKLQNVNIILHIKRGTIEDQMNSG